jgi:hypothetical protein
MNISLQALRDRREQLTASLARVDDLRPGFSPRDFVNVASATVTALRRIPRDTARPIR